MSMCPVCGRKAIRRCRCRRSDKTCENGHDWHTCIVHHTDVLGKSHNAGRPFKSDGCSCIESKSGLRTNCGLDLKIGDEVIIDGILRGTITREDKEPDPIYLPGASCNFYIEDKDGVEHVVKPFFIVHKAEGCKCRVPMRK